MPAKENVIVLSSGGADCKETTLIRKDVDSLVQEIKENLKLTQLEAAAAVQCGGGAGGSSSGTTAAPGLVVGQDYPPPAAGALKARSHLSSRGSRASPYSVPDRLKSSKCECSAEGGAAGGGTGAQRGSWAARKRYPSMSANGKQKLDLEDPLEMLQELISEGNLLKEAVRRLQLGLTPKIQRNFYDSDEDCRTPTANTYPELCGV